MYGYNIMDSMHPALVGGLLYAAVMAGMSVASGAPLDLMGVAVDGGLMGVSLVANEMLHNALELEASMLSSAAATGGSYAALQSVVKGNQDLVMNAAAGAATDVALGMVFGRG